MSRFTCLSDAASNTEEINATEQEAIRQARADLGDHRVQNLPLAGIAVRLNRRQRQKLLQGSNLHNVQPAIASWHMACVEESTEPLVRPDGIGSGGLHRLGPNYRPDGAKWKQLSTPRGRGRANRGQTSLRARAITNGSRSWSNSAQMSQKIGSTSAFVGDRAKDTQPPEYGIQDRNWIAAYPDAQERRKAMAATREATAVQRASIVGDSRLTPITSTANRSVVANYFNNVSTTKTTSTQSFPARGLEARATGHVKVQSLLANAEVRPPRQARTAFDASSLSDQPFWSITHSATEHGANTFPAQVFAQSIKSLSREPKSSSQPISACEKEEHQVGTTSLSASDHVKQSSEGYLQKRQEDLPIHCKKVVVLPRECRTLVTHEEVSDSEYSSDVYSEPDLQNILSVKQFSKSHRTVSTSNILEGLSRPGVTSSKLGADHSYENAENLSLETSLVKSTDLNYQKIIESLQLPGITILDHL